MKKHEKVFSLLMVLIFSISMLAGCSNASSNKDSESKGNASKDNGNKQINILMESVPDTEIIQKHISEFEEKTGIKVNIESISYSSMHEKLLTQMLGSTNAYDVIVVDCYWTGEFVEAGWLEDLGSYIKKSGFDTSAYIDSMMDMVGEIDGTTYMIPFYNYMMSLVYRTDVFEDEKLKASYKAKYGKDFTIPDTFEEYIEMCKFITKDSNGEMYGAVMQGLRPDPIAVEWLNYLYTCGGDFYDEAGNIIINNEAAVKALNLYIDNINNAAPKGATGFGFDEAFNVFAQGDAATYMTYNWMVPKLNNDNESTVQGLVDISAIPNGTSLNAGWGWAIPHNAPDKDASWEFLQWVESFDMAKARALDGGSPTREDVMKDSEVLKAYPYLSTVLDIMKGSKILPVMADTPKLVEVLGRELSLAATNEKTSQEALDTVAEEMKSMK